MWHNAIYEPGEVKVVAYDEHGTAKAEKIIRTAGKPHHIELVSSRQSLTADGKDLAYVTVLWTKTEISAPQICAW